MRSVPFGLPRWNRGDASGRSARRGSFHYQDAAPAISKSRAIAEVPEVMDLVMNAPLRGALGGISWTANPDLSSPSAIRRHPANELERVHTAEVGGLSDSAPT